MANIYKKPIVVRDPKTGAKVKTKSKKWWGRFTDALGREKRIPLCTDKRAAQAMLTEAVQKSERQRVGLEDPAEDEMQKPIEAHLRDFEAHLVGRDVTEGHVKASLTQIRKIVDFNRWRIVADITAADVTRFLNDLRRKGRSAQTHNHYLKSIKHLTKWLEREKRNTHNPLLHLSRLNVKTDRRHDRRALSEEEFTLLLEAAETGPPIEGICGPDRAMMYLLAAYTGFRKGELGSLTIRSFDLEGDPPTMTVAAGFSKRRRRDTQVLHPDVVARLEAWLACRGEPGAKGLLFPVSARSGGQERKTYKMMREDLAAARRKWIAEKDSRKRKQSDFLTYCNHDGLFADFHSNRHTFITNLCRAKVSPKAAQTLARHSDIRLTMDVYSHVDQKEQVDAIRSLPGLGKPDQAA